MAKYKIRVIAKRRAEVDLDKLAQALLRLVEETQPKRAAKPKPDSQGGVTDASGTAA